MIDDKKIEEAASVASISDSEKGRVREGYVINALADHENGFLVKAILKVLSGLSMSS